MAQEATPAARWHYEPQATSDQMMGGWRLHTVWGGIAPGHHRFSPRVAGVADVWKNSLCGDGTVSSPGAARPRRWPEGQLSPRVKDVRRRHFNPLTDGNFQ